MKLWCLMNDIEGIRPARPVLAQPPRPKKEPGVIGRDISDLMGVCVGGDLMCLKQGLGATTYNVW